MELGADIVDADYRQLPQQPDQFDLLCFTPPIYYFDQYWGQLARAAFVSVRPGGSLVFILNGDEGDPAELPNELAASGYGDLAPLDIGSFINARGDAHLSLSAPGQCRRSRVGHARADGAGA